MPLPPVAHWGFETAALTLGGLLYWRRSNAASQPPDRWTRWGLLAGAALGAAIGSRALYVAQYFPDLRAQSLAVWFGGKTIVGGLCGAILGVEGAKLTLHWKRSTGDGFVVPLIVAILLGRLGCQFSGLDDLTYGNPTSLPWGWDYGDHISRHPTAFYEMAGVLIIGGSIWRLSFPRSGDYFRAFMVGYFLLRLGLEFLKPPFGVPAPGLLKPQQWASLTPIQWACIGGLAYYGRDINRWVREGTGHAESSTVSLL